MILLIEVSRVKTSFSPFAEITMKDKNPYRLVPTLSLSESYQDKTLGGTIPLEPFLKFSQFLFTYSSMPFAVPTSIMEGLFSEAIGGYVVKGMGKVDVISSDNKTAYQIKTMVSVCNYTVWGRMTLRNKLEMLPASLIDAGVCSTIGNNLLDELHAEFEQTFKVFSRFVYVQVMKEDTGHTLLLVNEICREKLLDFLLSNFEWKWSKKPTNPDHYQSLRAYYMGKHVFTWNGLSGNHFRITDLAYFLNEVSVSSVCIRLPASISNLTHEQLVGKMG